MKLLVITLLLLFASNASAESFSHTDVIQKIVFVDGDDKDYITLANFSSAGNCPKSKGLVIAKFKSDDTSNRGFSLALSAKVANKQVRLVVDDTLLNSEGFCIVKALELEDLGS